MNNLMIFGFAIMFLGIVITFVWYFVLYKKQTSINLKSRILLFSVLTVFTIIGMIIAQKGADKDKLEFKADELALLNSGKSYAAFSEKEKQLLVLISFRYTQRDDEEVRKYDDVLLNWKIDEYLENNKHREITREEAEKIVLQKWKTDKEFSKNF